MGTSKGLSLLEVLLSLAILAGSILVVAGVMTHGLLGIKKGENYAIASNLAMSQFEVYKDRFHMIPFYPGVAKGLYMYPDRTQPADSSQIGAFVHHTVSSADLPTGTTYYGASDHASADFYHNAPAPYGNDSTPYYDLNQDNFPNDVIEPLAPQIVEGVTFTPVVEIKSWTNGFNINEIKHLVVTVYWVERNAEGTKSSRKKVEFQGFIARTQPDPW